MSIEKDIREEDLPSCHRMVAWMIRKHTAEAPILSKDLERIYRITGPQVRQIVRYYRLQRNPIGSGPKGYYYARTRAELEPALNNLRSRSYIMLAEVKVLEQCFSGQQSLF